MAALKIWLSFVLLLSLPPWNSLFLNTILLFDLALKICNTAPGKYLGKNQLTTHACTNSVAFLLTIHHITDYIYKDRFELLRYKNINAVMGFQYLTDTHQSLPFWQSASNFAVCAYRWIMNRYLLYTEFNSRLENFPTSTVGNSEKSCYSKTHSYPMLHSSYSNKYSFTEMDCASFVFVYETHPFWSYLSLKITPLCNRVIHYSQSMYIHLIAQRLKASYNLKFFHNG